MRGRCLMKMNTVTKKLSSDLQEIESDTSIENTTSLLQSFVAKACYEIQS